MNTALTRAIGAAGLLLVSAAASQAASHNFDFGTIAGAPGAAYAAAGVAGIWNTAPSGAGTGATYIGMAGMQLVGAADVPLPAGGLLLLSGLGLAGLAGRRKRG